MSLFFLMMQATQKDKIVTITDILYNNYNNFYLNSQTNALSKGNNKTLTLRIELIRIYTLGVTGFDTPGSLNISEEAAFAFRGMQKYIQTEPYFMNFNTSNANEIITETVSYLSDHKDFETFDRIEFYKKYVQLLYEELGKWDGNPDDLKEFSGWNISNKNFFSSDFLDPYFFTVLKDSEDSQELRNLGKEIFF